MEYTIVLEVTEEHERGLDEIVKVELTVPELLSF